MTISLHLAWWLKYYLMGLMLMHSLTGMEINEQRVAWWVRRAIKVKAK